MAGETSCLCALPSWIKIERASAVSRASRNLSYPWQTKPWMVQPVADAEFFPVEKVLRRRTQQGRRQVLVKFLGYKEPRWVDASAVEAV